MATVQNSCVFVAVYATGFRGDQMEEVLAELAPFSLRYGATGYRVFRAADDLYKFNVEFDFASKAEWDAFWAGPEWTRFRQIRSGWFQIPLLYAWQDTVASGGLVAAAEGEGAGTEAQGEARLGA